jgi:hypothetical protein
MLRTRGPAFSARAQASTAIEKQMQLSNHEFATFHHTSYLENHKKYWYWKALIHNSSKKS